MVIVFVVGGLIVLLAVASIVAFGQWRVARIADDRGTGLQQGVDYWRNRALETEQALRLALKDPRETVRYEVIPHGDEPS